MEEKIFCDCGCEMLREEPYKRPMKVYDGYSGYTDITSTSSVPNNVPHGQPFDKPKIRFTTYICPKCGKRKQIRE